MSKFIPWNSQSLELWSEKFAKGKFVDLEGHRTHYLKKGNGDPLILLHGFFYDSYLWAENIDALAEKFEVYVIDLWGFGYSTRELLDFGYELYAKQIRLFMDAMGIEKASLMGQSMGGGISIKFCVQNRDRVNSLVLVDAAGLPNPLPLTGKIFNLPKVGEFLMGLKTDKVRKKNLSDLWMYDAQKVTESYFENAMRFHKIKGSTEVIMKILRKEFFHTLSEEIKQLGEMNVPSLLVWGKQDVAVPYHTGQKMHEILKGSQFEAINNAGHLPNYEHYELFNKLVLDFLSRI
jgi:pimeloyl-ACP methyl ester carboxylesterase